MISLHTQNKCSGLFQQRFELGKIRNTKDTKMRFFFFFYLEHESLKTSLELKSLLRYGLIISLQYRRKAVSQRYIKSKQVKGSGEATFLEV